MNIKKFILITYNFLIMFEYIACFIYFLPQITPLKTRLTSWGQFFQSQSSIGVVKFVLFDIEHNQLIFIMLYAVCVADYRQVYLKYSLK